MTDVPVSLLTPDAYPTMSEALSGISSRKLPQHPSPFIKSSGKSFTSHFTYFQQQEGWHFPKVSNQHLTSKPQKPLQVVKYLNCNSNLIKILIKKSINKQPVYKIEPLPVALVMQSLSSENSQFKEKKKPTLKPTPTKPHYFHSLLTSVIFSQKYVGFLHVLHRY